MKQEIATCREKQLADVKAEVHRTVWKVVCTVGESIQQGDTVAILESMKMEMPVEAPFSGKMKQILCREGQAVNEANSLRSRIAGGPETGLGHD